MKNNSKKEFSEAQNKSNENLMTKVLQLLFLELNPNEMEFCAPISSFLGKNSQNKCTTELIHPLDSDQISVAKKAEKILSLLFVFSKLDVHSGKYVEMLLKTTNKKDLGEFQQKNPQSQYWKILVREKEKKLLSASQF
jgi:hypothetical protein